jgi:mono/diheme cytochrome c family protein
VKASVLALLTALVVTSIASTASAAPVVVGLSGQHPLSEPQVGELLIGELHCLACHSRTGVAQPLERAAPDLSDVGARVAPEFLRRFIASPSAAHAGTTMPDLLAAGPENERNKTAEAITHFLVAQSPHKFQPEAVGDKEAAAGKNLFHTVGCVACHSPRDESGKELTHEGVVELGHVPSKYSPASLSEFLFQPARVRPSGRMPDMKLTPAEAKAIAAYLLGKADKPEPPLQTKDELVALGKKQFQQLNCAACHKLGAIPAAAPAADLRGSDTSRGCLSNAPGKAPRFHPSDDQLKAIRAALAKPAEAPSDSVRLATTLTAFNCIACHVRDGFGGVSPDRNPLFQTTAKNLGDDARIPPPLTLAGAKLQPVWMKKVLFDGESVRPYMFTRMPQYGEPNLRHLPDLFARLDKVENFAFALPNPESDDEKERTRSRVLRDAGRELVGDKGLNCIACHRFNGKTANGDMDGMELLTSFQRLKPSWYYRFMRDPGAFRRRIVMPTSWPGGIAVQKTVLKGDTDQQLEAIWYYLSLGTSAAEPSGLRPTETKLFVTDATRTYRGRSSVAGFRGIAVGFPEKLSYAFNAETGTLTALWQGEFIRVDRGGQGSGSFNPASRHVPLAQDVSFFALADEKSPWPLRPVMTKDQPVNPDPLYPKNRGYQFKGYYMDDASVPTFMYRSGDIGIEDRSAPGAEKGRLVRTLTLDSPKAQTVWFRALTGKVEAESKQRFKTPELRLSLPPAETVLRPMSADKTASELLLKIAVPKGKSELAVTYELLK